jgi:Golgi nucleoside diphosphatase
VYEWSHDNRKVQEKFQIVVHSISGESAEIYGHENGLAYLRVQTEPGLDKFLHNESGLRASIEPLLNWAEQHIPSDAHRKTLVFLLATASLRKLPSSDAKWILNKAWAILVTYPFICQRSRVRVISGVEEVYYGWVALNYNMDKIDNTHGHKTFGALDLGGSSLEVTFEPGEETKGEYTEKFNIGSVEHQLYAYSLPAYGLNDAFEKSVIMLHKKLSERSNEELRFSNNQMILQIKHPCLQAGYRQSYHCSKCYPNQAGSPQNGSFYALSGFFFVYKF